MNFKTVIDYWKPFDERLPKKVDREPPTNAFIESIRDIQLQPIGVGWNEKEGYFLMYGRKRLLAVRTLAENPEYKDIKIRVELFKGITKADALQYTVIENQHRSGNELTDYLSIKKMLRTPTLGTYDLIAEQLGLSVSIIRAIDQKYSNIPEWAIKAAVKGSIALGTAKKIGALKPDTQEKVHEEFKKNGELTFNQVAQTQKAVYTNIMPELLEEKPIFTKIENLVLLRKHIKESNPDSSEVIKILSKLIKGKDFNAE